jgi:hypothetical protein
VSQRGSVLHRSQGLETGSTSARERVTSGGPGPGLARRHRGFRFLYRAGSVAACLFVDRVVFKGRYAGSRRQRDEEGSVWEFAFSGRDSRED